MVKPLVKKLNKIRIYKKLPEDRHNKKKREKLKINLKNKLSNSP
jgi:hypothetical protein